MSTAPARPRLEAATLGQALVMLGLLVLCIALAGWQVEPLQWRAPGSARAGAAAAVALLWAGFTGLVLLQRRRATVAPAVPAADAAADWWVVHASQTGHAEALAHLSAQALQAAGQSVRVAGLGGLDVERLAQARRVLFIASTTGEGDAPDTALAFVRRAMQSPASLGSLQYGVLALGDREYRAYCAFGHALDAWLRHSHAHPLFDLIEVDNGDPGALRAWQQHLGQLGGHTGIPDWNAPAYQPWRLSERRHLNPGSPGGPVYTVSLRPDDAADLDWVAGDIAEVGPRHAAADVDAWLLDTGLDGEQPVRFGDTRICLRDALAASRLPALPKDGAWPDAQAVVDALQALPHREYSIASTPAEGSLVLLIRQVRHADGRLGSGSGWLTRHAPPGARIDLRIRRNSAFHAPTDDRPLVLVGNGTGLAGLRALLMTRIERGHHRNWLLFGERTRAHDLYFRDELAAWSAAGGLAHLDLVFSRDPGPLKYVQDAVRQQAARLARWVADGASIHVCGSLEGMAPGVDTALREVLGDAEVDALVEAGRYRRDIY
ncbi:sulfite reductase subunit alpha [Marilutibacter aestuarii]|uniref:NADPH--hemoprotein reductase n=1 Tax=Marilutibacter aestuarii TaxID=1706195 RepID=A0A508AEJ3_9GAMM|nr:sulfite reductase subunit alpha [Lysobacter aestuarii]TQD48279.1 sulfite reductase flavoprotein subunit alpha [Lysobacter aestuarii]